MEEVADLKIMPLWSTGILLGTAIGIFSSLTILQALTMNRHLGSHFKIPAASFLFFNQLLGTAISIFIIDHFLLPKWQNLTRQSLISLQHIGVGYVGDKIYSLWLNPAHQAKLEDKIERRVRDERGPWVRSIREGCKKKLEKWRLAQTRKGTSHLLADKHAQWRPGQIKAKSQRTNEFSSSFSSSTSGGRHLLQQDELQFSLYSKKQKAIRDYK